MPFVLQPDGDIGWKGRTGDTVHVRIEVAGTSRLIDVRYNGESRPSQPTLSANIWTTSIVIAANRHSLLFTFASIASDPVEVFEFSPDPASPTSNIAFSLSAAAAEQEIAEGTAKPTAEFLSTQIRGI